jgi:hypothetical protein
VQGWAFDFDNPDAGVGSMRAEEEAIIKQVISESLKETPKSAEQTKDDPLENQEQ